MKREISKKDASVDIASMTMFNAKAVVDGLVYAFPKMQLSIAIDEDTIIPLQGAVVTKDRKHMIFASNEVAGALTNSGKGQQVFKAMTDAEKIAKIGY